MKENKYFFVPGIEFEEKYTAFLLGLAYRMTDEKQIKAKKVVKTYDTNHSANFEK